MVNMVLLVDMPNPFIVQVKNDKQRRIVIDKEAWNELELQKGDYIEVTIKKIVTTGRNLS
jgi:hypothetical protein